MKKLILIIVIFVNSINANDNYELQLYEKVLPTIFRSSSIKVFTNDNVKNILKDSKKFIIVPKCQQADLLMISNKSDLLVNCKNKPIFAMSYRCFNLSNNSFGAFYWRKGRPQIKFRLKIIKKFNLYLPQSLKRYAK